MEGRVNVLDIPGPLLQSGVPHAMILSRIVYFLLLCGGEGCQKMSI